VKVHGAMVATSEVEVALISHPEVADAAVIAVPDEPGTRLVAYVVARDGTRLSAWKLRRDLSVQLSSTAVPSAFVALDVLPRTVRDKVDRTSLPPPPPAVRPKPYREPYGAQRDLALLFASVLGVDKVGLDDDFFELGGDSLGVVELLAAIKEEFGVDVASSTVLDRPTVATLSTELSHRRPRDASPLVDLRTDEPGEPFYCVTGAGAPAISLRDLSKAIGSHNFVAIQPRGLEERARPDRTIHAAARRNVLAIRAKQPTGPYRLGGYSYGGLVAFEMACLLERAGEHVELLVVVDAPARARRVTSSPGPASASSRSERRHHPDGCSELWPSERAWVAPGLAGRRRTFATGSRSAPRDSCGAAGSTNTTSSSPSTRTWRSTTNPRLRSADPCSSSGARPRARHSCLTSTTS
jgi:acyl carrier protein